jgi:hypothetical protein
MKKTWKKWPINDDNIKNIYIYIIKEEWCQNIQPSRYKWLRARQATGFNKRRKENSGFIKADEIQTALFVVSLNTVALSHSKPASADKPSNNRCAQR